MVAEKESLRVSHNGSSLNDYFLVSLDFPESRIVQVHVSPPVESQHMPVSYVSSGGSGTGNDIASAEWVAHFKHTLSQFMVQTRVTIIFLEI